MNQINNPPEKITFRSSRTDATVFLRSENKIWLDQIFGMKCGLNNADNGPAITRGLCILETSDQRYEGGFRGGKRNGYGQVTSADGKVQSGRWDDGKPVETTP